MRAAAAAVLVVFFCVWDVCGSLVEKVFLSARVRGGFSCRLVASCWTCLHFIIGLW